MSSHISNGLTFTIYLDNGDLYIKATDFTNLTDYMCIIKPESLSNNKILNNVELIYDILNENFDNTDLVNNRRDCKNNTIIITVSVNHIYFNEQIEYVMINAEELTNIQEMNNKLKYFNHNLNNFREEMDELVLYKKFIPIVDSVGTVKFAPKSLDTIYFNTIDNMYVLNSSIDENNTVTMVFRYTLCDIADVSKLDFAKQFKHITKLYLGIMSDIPTYILEEFPNIDTVYIQGGTITNIAPISRLNIKILHIRNCTTITNLQALENMETLETLYHQNTLNIVYSKEKHFETIIIT